MFLAVLEATATQKPNMGKCELLPRETPHMGGFF